MIKTLDELHTRLTGWIFEILLQPVLYATNLMNIADEMLEWVDFALFSIFGMMVIYAICRPLEAWRPVEPVTDRRAIRTDIIYTLLARLGIFPLLAFIFLFAIQSQLEGLLADTGFVAPTLETFFPALREAPLLTFFLYVVILDFGEYWRHRLQHSIGWWWALHSIHHAQRQMTFWTDDRNHILDEAIAALWFGTIALLIGVTPAQFPLLLLLMRLVEAFSHGNIRLSFGRIGERLVVSPRYHRLHHGVLSTAEHGKNYAVLFPVWDWIFGTADFSRQTYPRTGDPTAPEAMATGGWLVQQWAGFKRMIGVGGRV
ncbi:MAG: sterol desaturase family protein [Roseomonas sp.]|nr:sterol desaturase family protein [Roseomonas sp.]MCA3328535.1 sterol desaturase family protein [Roseomonas sp.]MCA3330035.1 sterol desaturase family protein [Roseomonas sp.]MCA3333697.1 sterol desaturase family protein [Roseomonas sp.]MCA3346149.1 sterol desaturase family protein [Roseomonas sp.]